MACLANDDDNGADIVRDKKEADRDYSLNRYRWLVGSQPFLFRDLTFLQRHGVRELSTLDRWLISESMGYEITSRRRELLGNLHPPTLVHLAKIPLIKRN